MVCNSISLFLLGLVTDYSLTCRYNSLFSGRSQLTTLLGFAFTLVIDLHLYLPMASYPNHEDFLDEMKVIVSCDYATWTRKVEPSKDEKRAILGCFFIFASV
jgi:hypothetical protein